LLVGSWVERFWDKGQGFSAEDSGLRFPPPTTYYRLSPKCSSYKKINKRILDLGVRTCRGMGSPSTSASPATKVQTFKVSHTRVSYLRVLSVFYKYFAKFNLGETKHLLQIQNVILFQRASSIRYSHYYILIGQITVSRSSAV